MKTKKKLYVRELQLQIANERIKELEHGLASKNKLLDHYDKTIRSCESACIYHQERADKAEKIIGRMMVEQELE
jgi:dTDP-4-amino-4,6-dideoxygalactose transaminase